MRLGLIGFGTIATLACDALVGAVTAPADLLICLARRESLARAGDWIAQYRSRLARDVQVTDDLRAFLAARPQVVAEAAGHAALREAGAPILTGGADLIVCSVGGLADDALRQSLEAAATRGGRQLIRSPGAIGGLDILAAARLSGLHSVHYTGRKSPLAWRGTPAEQVTRLEALTSPCIVFEGSAREAAIRFPQNANVAATIALAGAGLDATHVALVADPGVDRNLHEIVMRSACADVSIRIEGHPAPGNPKTSSTTGYALAALLLEYVPAG